MLCLFFRERERDQLIELMHVLFYTMAQDMMLMMDICLRRTSHWMTAVRQRETTPTSIQLSHLLIKFVNNNGQRWGQNAIII